MESAERVFALPLRRPSRRALIAIGFLAVLSGLAIAAVLWLQSYAPLKWGGISSYATPHVKPGARFSVGLDLRNRGMLPVKIKHVVSYGSPLAAFKPIGLRVQPAPFDGGVTLSPTTSAPFTIGSHESRFVYVDFRVATCAAAQLGPGTGATLGGVQLRYSYAGLFTRNQWVQLPRRPTLRC